MDLDLWSLYRQMYHSRMFEEAVVQLWEEGLISGEMHLGIGEEAIVAGILDHMLEGDALALDHRGTPPLVMRDIDPVLLLREFMGQPGGLCGGKGGHMHLFSRDHLAASSGIVGASGPIAVGFALAGVYLRPGTAAVAFFGEGAVNQGMLMEAFNLASTWNLPVLFVCKDNQWAISTPSPSVTAGDLIQRAAGFGMHTQGVDGSDVESVWTAAGEAFTRARNGSGPTFILASCTHPRGHYLGDPMLRMSAQPLKEFMKRAGPLFRSLLSGAGAPLMERVQGMRGIMGDVREMEDQITSVEDPIERLRHRLSTDQERLESLEEDVMVQIVANVETALDAAHPTWRQSI